MKSTPLFPLGNALFPDGTLNLRIFEVRYLDMIKKCIANQSPFGVVQLLSGSEVRTPEGVETLGAAGTLARIEEWRAPMPGLLQIRCIGAGRFRLVASEQLKHGLWMGETAAIADDPAVPVPLPLQSAANALGKLIADLQRQGVAAADMPIAAPFRLDESGWVADRWSELLPLPPQQKQELLVMTDPVARLEWIHACLADRGIAP